MVTFDELEKADVSDLPIRKRVEAFYKGTDAISKFAESVIIPVLKGQLNLNDREIAIVGTYYRMYAWISSMVAMNNPIYFQGAAAAARALFELLLDIKMLGTDQTSKSIQRFHAFPEVEKFRVAQKLVRFCDNHPNTIDRNLTTQRSFINSNERKRNIETSIRKHWGTTKEGKPNRPKHWTGKNIPARAHVLGPEYEELYFEAYPLLSWYIHSGSTGYVGVTQEALQSCFGWSHIIAQKAFLEATLICAQEMKISLALEGLPNMLEDLRLTPGKVLTEEQIKILKEAK